MSRLTAREVVLLMARAIDPTGAPEDDEYIGDWAPEHAHANHLGGPDCAACWLADFDSAVRRDADGTQYGVRYPEQLTVDAHWKTVVSSDLEEVRDIANYINRGATRAGNEPPAQMLARTVTYGEWKPYPDPAATADELRS